MSTHSMVLLCAGAAASLMAVWALAGLGERSSWRGTLRAWSATAIGVLGIALVHGRAPAAARGELLLPALFSLVAVLALLAGAGKLDAALADANRPLSIRRASGLIGGTFLAMAAIAATSVELVSSSLARARVGWAYMLAPVAAALVVFAQRGRLASAGALALGRRALLLGAVGLGLLVVARVTLRPKPAGNESGRPRPAAAAAEQSAPASLPEARELEPVPAASAPLPVASASAAPAPSAPPAVAGSSGELKIENVVTHGLLDADARGGVERRRDRLQACMSDPQNQQSGTLKLKIGVDAAGSVNYAKPLEGELLGTALAACLLSAFYKMGFAAPASDSAYFEIHLRAR